VSRLCLFFPVLFVSPLRSNLVDNAFSPIGKRGIGSEIQLKNSSPSANRRLFVAGLGKVEVHPAIFLVGKMMSSRRPGGRGLPVSPCFMLPGLILLYFWESTASGRRNQQERGKHGKGGSREGSGEKNKEREQQDYDLAQRMAHGEIYYLVPVQVVFYVGSFAIAMSREPKNGGIYIRTYLHRFDQLI
jgi:hypothetical protein